MKKILLISSLLALGIVTDAMAKPLICPFTDYFTVNAPRGSTIKELFTLSLKILFILQRTAEIIMTLIMALHT